MEQNTHKDKFLEKLFELGLKTDANKLSMTKKEMLRGKYNISVLDYIFVSRSIKF